MARKSASPFSAMARSWSGVRQLTNSTFSATSASSPASTMRMSGLLTVAKGPASSRRGTFFVPTTAGAAGEAALPETAADPAEAPAAAVAGPDPACAAASAAARAQPGRALPASRAALPSRARRRVPMGVRVTNTFLLMFSPRSGKGAARRNGGLPPSGWRCSGVPADPPLECRCVRIHPGASGIPGSPGMFPVPRSQKLPCHVTSRLRPGASSSRPVSPSARWSW